MAATGNGDRRLQHLVEANARRIPVLEGKLRILLSALHGEEVGRGAETQGSGERGSGDGGGNDGGEDSSGNRSEMLEVLETRIANQQAEWNAQNDAMEQKLAELADKRTAAVAARQQHQSDGVSGMLVWRLWLWMKQNTKLSALLALMLLLVLRRRRLL